MPKYKRLSDLFLKKTTPNTLLLFLVPFFLILLGDGILTYIFPIALEGHVNSNFITGLILSLSSVIGILCDFFIPLIFSKYTWRFQLIAGILLAITFPIATALGDMYSIVWLFIIASLLWGIYFEFLMFAQQGFIVAEEKPADYSHDWGIIEFLTDLVEIVGPIIGALLLIRGIFAYTSVTIFVEVIALILAILLVISRRSFPAQRPKSNLKEYVGFFKELKYWNILSKKVYIILIMAIIVEIVFAAFQTFAGLYGQQIINNPSWDWLILGFSTIPTLLGTLVISKLNISKGKKRLSQLAIILGGLVLSSLFLFNGKLIPILVIVFISNLIFSVCWPLDDAIFSDLQKRLKEKNLHMIGLSQASYSIAYIITPTITGFLADRVGYNNTFAIIGGVSAILGIILVLVTPRKLRLPQKELAHVE